MASADSPAARRVGAWWWCLIPFLSLGLLSGVMVLIAGVRLRHQRTQLLALPYLLLCVGGFSAAPYVQAATSGAWAVLTTAMLLANWLGGTLHVFLLQRRPAPAPAAELVPAAGGGTATVGATAPGRAPIAPIVRKRLVLGLAVALLLNLPLGVILITVAASPPYTSTDAEGAFFSGALELPLLFVTFAVGAILLRQGRGFGHGLLYGAALSALMWCGPCVVMSGSAGAG
jgi:hypothetical protein